jgi:hypothetical protein
MDVLREVDCETKDACEIVHYAVMNGTSVDFTFIKRILPDV